MQKNRVIAADIEEALEKVPDATSAILERARAFDRKRKETLISIYSFRKMSPMWNAVSKGITALLGLPYFIFSAIAALPMWATEFKIRSSVKDPAFRNTVSFGVKLAMKLVIFPLYAVLAFCLAPWWIAIAFLALYIPSYYYFHDYIEGCRRWFSDLRLLNNKKLYKEFKSIVKDFKTLQTKTV